MVSIRNLHKQYGELEVLKGVDLDIAAGEVVCIIGPSGSGKTTLLRCVNFLETYQDGRVYVDQQLVGYEERNGALKPASEKSIARLRAETSMVFQQFNLFPHMTALRNVTFGPMKVRKSRKSPGRKNGPCPARPGGVSGKGRFVSGAALGRATTAGCHRPRAGDGAQGHSLR